MKKIIIAILAIFIICGLPAMYGIVFPMPISGTVEGAPAGTNIQVSNLRTGIQVIEETNEYGQFLIEWSNTDNIGGTITCVLPGDKFELKVVGCEEAACSDTQTYDGGPEVYFNLEGIDMFDVCRCVSLTDWQAIGGGILLTLIMTLVGWMGGGIKIYKNLKGMPVFHHRHRGIQEYHDPNTIHRNPAYRHRRWSEDPKGCIEDVKKIEEQGGLI